MERKSPRWLSNELLRLVDHKRAVKKKVGLVCMFEYGSANKGERLSHCVFVCVCVCVCVCMCVCVCACVPEEDLKRSLAPSWPG